MSTVRIHPASDWFMKGVTHATVLKNNGPVYRVRCQRTNTVFTINVAYLLKLNGDPVHTQPASPSTTG